MTRRRENQMLTHVNRALIAVLSLAGMLLDGGQLADLVLELAVVLWLWTPELHLLELALLRQAQLRATRQVGQR